MGSGEGKGKGTHPLEWKEVDIAWHRAAAADRLNVDDQRCYARELEARQDSSLVQVFYFYFYFLLLTVLY